MRKFVGPTQTLDPRTLGRTLGFTKANVNKSGIHRVSHRDDAEECSSSRGREVPMERCAIVSLAASLMVFSNQPDAEALLSSPKTQIPRTAEAALRRSVPAFNRKVYDLQKNLENIAYQLRIPQRKPWKDMQEYAARARDLAQDESGVLDGVLPDDVEEALSLLSGIQSDLNKLLKSIEIKDSDRTSIRVANALERVGNLELLQTPGLPYSIPGKYQSMPRLTGRAVVELVIQKQKGAAPFYVNESGDRERATIQITLDGFAAPLSAGRFAKNVLNHIYDGTTLSVDDSSVFGNPKEPLDSDQSVPLEILARGDLEPTYGNSGLDVNSGEMPTLPLSIYGSVSMTKLDDGNSSGSDFFIFKYNRQQSGLSGLSFDEGRFGVFGYVTSNANVLQQIENGDRIVSSKFVSGIDKLIE